MVVLVCAVCCHLNLLPNSMIDREERLTVLCAHLACDPSFAASSVEVRLLLIHFGPLFFAMLPLFSSPLTMPSFLIERRQSCLSHSLKNNLHPLVCDFIALTDDYSIGSRCDKKIRHYRNFKNSLSVVFSFG
jgi:hypothetical protein